MWAQRRSSERFASTASVERDRSRRLGGGRDRVPVTGRTATASQDPPRVHELGPEHYFAEVAGVLRRAEINGRHTEAQVRIALDRLLAAPLRRVSVRSLIPEAWLLRHNMTVADSLYVVIARHLGADLVTTDLRLANSPTLPVATITP